MLQFILRKIFTQLIYPTKSRDWYKLKEYQGADDTEIFAGFLSAQQEKNSHFYNEFLSLKLTRQYIESSNDKLDSVLAVPDQDFAKGKAGELLYFIMLQGRGEYYEGRFRDIAKLAQETGASVLGFNPKGVHCSSGKTRCLQDIVDDGIAAVEFLLQRGVGHNQIILLGNSLGAAVGEMISEHYRSINGVPLYQINSNSFRSLGAVMASSYKIQFLEKYLDKILKYSGWGIILGKGFYKTGPYRCHMRRLGDKTILADAEYHCMVDFNNDNISCPDHYKEAHKWLYNHSQIIYRGDKKTDPHELGLHCFEIKSNDTYLPVYNLINRYISFLKR